MTTKYQLPPGTLLLRDPNTGQEYYPGRTYWPSELPPYLVVSFAAVEVDVTPAAEVPLSPITHDPPETPKKRKGP